MKLHAVDVKTLPSRDSIAFVSQRASPATYAWVKVVGVQNYESRLTGDPFVAAVVVHVPIHAVCRHTVPDTASIDLSSERSYKHAKPQAETRRVCAQRVSSPREVGVRVYHERISS